MANDYPIDVCMERADQVIAKGLYVYQKFTCARCGARNTMTEANKFFATGICSNCDSVTDIKKRGCNYLVSTCPLPVSS